MAEIRASLTVGKTVITHTDAVSIPGGWSGAGYIILDPETNVGAWKIGGGLNGGVLAALLGALVNLLQIMVFLAVFAVSTLLTALIALLSALIIPLLVAAIVASEILLEAAAILIGMVFNLVDLLSGCASRAAAIALVAVFAFVDIVVAMLLAVTGVGLFVLIPLEAILFALEGWITTGIKNSLICQRG